MCNSIHTCQTAIFDWLKHSICMDMKCGKEKKKVSLFFLCNFCLLDSSTAQCGQVESPNPVKYTFFIHPSVHPSPLSIYPVRSRVAGVSPQLGMREKKGQFSMYSIFHKNHTSRFEPRRGCNWHNRGPPIGWHSLNWLMRNVPAVLFAEV